MIHLKKLGVLNHRISDVIAQMGHGDQLVVADAGLPIPVDVERIDMALAAGVPSILQVLEAVTIELQVEQIVVADELLASRGALPRELSRMFPDAEIASISHEAFKERCAQARAVIRTGECTPFANVILVGGVTF
ncbi:D-ribose pyranase [soil metagenome]